MIPTDSGKGKPELSFVEKLRRAISARSTMLCIGLDPELARLPDGFDRSADGVVQFNREVIGATSDLVCAYKPNFAFYEALGNRGFDALSGTLSHIPSEIAVIGDAKRG